MMFSAIRPLLFTLDAERAHTLTIRLLAARGRVGPLTTPRADTVLATEVAGVRFANPIGVAAGVDKNGEAIDGLLSLGFGSVEIGTLTPLAQPGNPRPRLFRLVADRAVINRFGFNNGGLAAALPRVAEAGRWGGSGRVGINVGANKDAADRVADYVAGVTLAAPLADYVTINISSPNTPGLRDLQHGAALAELLSACTAAKGTTPLFLKVAPDLEAATIDAIAHAVIDAKVDALIVSNTTISRPPLKSPAAGEAGGLSGAPLASLAAERLPHGGRRAGAFGRGRRHRLGGGGLCPHPRRRELGPALHRDGV
jgi:dihydroorotate dehydrogenase